MKNLIKHNTNSRQPMITIFKNDEWILATSTQLTRFGYQFLERFDRNTFQLSQTFNVETTYESAFRYKNKVNTTYSNTSLEDLKSFVEGKEYSEDKQVGDNLIEVLENEQPKPGFLSKFEYFLDTCIHFTDEIIESIYEVI